MQLPLTEEAARGERLVTIAKIIVAGYRIPSKNPIVIFEDTQGERHVLGEIYSEGGSPVRPESLKEGMLITVLQEKRTKKAP